MTEEQRSPEEIREEIEESREELGDTAAALAEKADVKKQAKKDEVAEKAPAAAGAAVEQAQRFVRENPTALAIGGAFVAGFALGRRRSR